MTQQPTVFGNHYYKELLADGGAFPSDKGLLANPVTAQWVRHDAAASMRCSYAWIRTLTQPESGPHDD